MSEYIVRKEFKYDGETFEPGMTWEPSGGKWDESIIDESHGFVMETESNKFVCDYCGKEWDSVRSKAAHMRFCKERPDGD